ncbi:MAG: DsbA family oxidoreductase [Pseudomonadota bacterium]
MTAPVSVDLVMDIVCPWCWLGHRYWAQAVDLAKEVEVETVLRPFQLDADIPPAGLPYRDYMAKKFAGDSSGRWKMMREHLETAGPEVGIVFNFDDIPVRPNTLNAHRLIRWARGQDQSEAMAEALFKAFFEDRRDVGDAATLAELAGSVGLDPVIIADLLTSDRDAEAVRQEERFYRSLGVGGVPMYIFNGRFAVSGAETPDVLAKAIRQAAEQPGEPLQ